MERFYSESQEELFAEVKIVSPFRQWQSPKPSAAMQADGDALTAECEICCLMLSKEVCPTYINLDFII